MAPTQVLDLDAITASLRDLQAHFSQINEFLTSRRDSFEDSVVANMIAGYGFVDSLLAQGINLLAMGNLKFFLELNALVLFGRDAGARGGATLQIAATEQRFYEQEGVAYARLSSGTTSTGRTRRGGVLPEFISLF